MKVADTCNHSGFGTCPTLKCNILIGKMSETESHAYVSRFKPKWFLVDLMLILILEYFGWFRTENIFSDSCRATFYHSNIFGSLLWLATRLSGCDRTWQWTFVVICRWSVLLFIMQQLRGESTWWVQWCVKALPFYLGVWTKLFTYIMCLFSSNQLCISWNDSKSQDSLIKHNQTWSNPTDL
jgi:hypothetical protein